MRNDWSELANSVRTEADFLRFAKELLADWKEEQEQLKVLPGPRYGAGPNGWENDGIDGFLSGMIQYAEDGGRYSPTGIKQYDAPPTWSHFAFLLLAGSRYE